MKSNAFKVLAEQISQRYTQGGLAQGDYVKFRNNILTHEKVKSRATGYRDMLISLQNSDFNLKISAIKPVRSANGQGGAGTDDFLADVCAESAPGTVMQVVTVPLECLELISPHDEYPQIPDGWKYNRKEGDKIGPEPAMTKAQDSHRQLKYESVQDDGWLDESTETDDEEPIEEEDDDDNEEEEVEESAPPRKIRQRSHSNPANESVSAPRRTRSKFNRL